MTAGDYYPHAPWLVCAGYCPQCRPVQFPGPGTPLPFEVVGEDLRWRRTLEETPPWRTRVLVRAQWSWHNPGEWWYDVTTYERRPYAPFLPGWRGDCGWGEPDHYTFWRPLP